VTDADAQAQAPEDGPAEHEEAGGRVTSAASAGGAAGASGVGLQNRVFGWAAASMVAERPLPRPNLVAGVVVRVGAQTGHELDDVAVQTDADNYALCQVKAGLKLGAAENSPLGKALQQAVKQYLKGPLRAADGTERAVDPERDALVICTDGAAPATVRDHLATAIRRTASQPPGTPLGQGSTAPQRKALNVLLGHVRRLWVAEGEAAPDDEQLRRFLRALRVIKVDANDGEEDHAVAVNMLSTPLPAPGDAARAWPVLVAEGQAASVGRDWRDRAAIGVALSREGIYLSPPAKHAGDIAKLRDVSAANLQAFQSDALLPVDGGLHISRGVSARLAAEAGGGNVLIVGDAGAGKSAIAQEFVTGRGVSQDVVVLRAADIAGVNRVQLNAPLTTVLGAWPGPPGVVLIDGVDALRGADDRGVLTGVVAGLRGSRWQIVATARTFDARNNHELQQAFSGRPISNDPTHVDGRLVGVRHILVGDLTDPELDAAIAPPLALASLLAEASPELRALLRNPFNLRLAARLAEHLSGSQHSELLAVRSRVDLLEAYWNRRVRNEDRTAREALLTRLCREMASTRSLRVVEAEPTVTVADNAAVHVMLSENVLSGDSGVLPAARRVLSFSHNILFDYAAALYLLLDPADPGRLLGTLDADPSLPLVARPSFEILVDLLWEHRNTGWFWPLCLDVAGSRHVLASLAIAARLLNLIRAADDLSPLAPEPGRVDRPDGMWPEQQFVRQLVGALRTSAVLADAAAAVVPLAALARSFAENAGASYVDAALAEDLLLGLQLRAPMRVGDPSAVDRGHTVAALLDGCRTDPPRMEQLAGAAARQLSHVIGLSDVARDAADRLLGDTGALQVWGGAVLTWLADAVVEVVAHDPDLARRMAAAVLNFRETRDEQVTFGGGALLPLTQSRRQQAEHGVYRLGQSFKRLCDADLVVASEIFCDLIRDRSTMPTKGQWPLSMTDVSGWLEYGWDLSLGTHDAGAHAAGALAAALTGTDPADALPALAVLVARLHNTAAWAALMTPADDDDAVRLGRVLLPVLESGALLAHPDTHSSAAGLLAALAKHEPAVASTLEAAVQAAHGVADANGLFQRIKDALIGCLRPDAIASPTLTARLEELGPDGPPEVLPRMQVTTTSTPWSVFEELAEQGVTLEASIESAGRALHEELRLLGGGGDSRPEAERRLPELFAEADAAFATSASLPTGLQQLLVDAAAALARDRRVLPGTPLGNRVLELLTMAADSPDAGSFLE
jgi:hypothetical protein